MGLRTARRLAIPFVLVAFGLRFAAEFWLESVLGFAVWLLLLMATLTLPLVGYSLLTRPARALPAEWRLDPARHGFTVGPSPSWAPPFTIFLGWLAGGVIATEPDVGTPLTVITMVLAALILTAAVAVLLVTDRPAVTLDPDGLTVWRYRGGARARWDDLTGPPVLTARDRTLELGTLRFGVRGLHVRTRLLAASIERYRTMPERRAAIGTEAELRELVSGSRTS
ncbi:MAG: hypothetical protein ABW022_12095 [Actinoplanes sp.]